MEKITKYSQICCPKTKCIVIFNGKKDSLSFSLGPRNKIFKISV